MDQLVKRIRADYPAFSFTVGDSACWSPGNGQVSYTLDDKWGAAGLLHELAHALLSHTAYRTDMDLLHKEVAAWEKARSLSIAYGLSLDENHIQDCLDTYRDWLHKRSQCPTCSVNGLQTSVRCYSCLNCGNVWQVSNSRLCRPYRRAMQAKQKTGR